MSKLSTVLTVKSGSTTKTVNLYSSTSDMTSGSSTNEYITLKANGSTCYAAVAASGTTAYNTYGTDLKYKDSSGNVRYLLTEPYFAATTPSYSGTITIPTQTIYSNTSSGDYFDYNTYDTFWTSSGFYCNSGDKIVIKSTNNAFRLREGYSGSASISYSTYKAYIGVCRSSTFSKSSSDVYWSGGGSDFAHSGDDNENGYFYLSINSDTTINITTAGTYYVHAIWGSAELRTHALAEVYTAITIQVN